MTAKYLRVVWPVNLRPTSSSVSMFVCVKSCDLSPWCEPRNYRPSRDVRSCEINKCMIDKKVYCLIVKLEYICNLTSNCIHIIYQYFIFYMQMFGRVHRNASTASNIREHLFLGKKIFLYRRNRKVDLVK